MNIINFIFPIKTYHIGFQFKDTSFIADPNMCDQLKKTLEGFMYDKKIIDIQVASKKFIVENIALGCLSFSITTRRKIGSSHKGLNLFFRNCSVLYGEGTMKVYKVEAV